MELLQHNLIVLLFSIVAIVPILIDLILNNKDK